MLTTKYGHTPRDVVVVVVIVVLSHVIANSCACKPACLQA